MGVMCLLLDRKKQYYSLLADIFNITGHKLLIAYDYNKARELLNISSPEVAILPKEDLSFWLSLLEEGRFIIPIFFLDSYEEAEELRPFGLREANYIVLPFNPMELLTKVVSIKKDIYEPAYLDYLGPTSVLLKYLSLRLDLCIKLEGQSGVCHLYLSGGRLLGSSCSLEELSRLFTQDLKITLDKLKDRNPENSFLDGLESLLKIIHVPGKEEVLAEPLEEKPNLEDMPSTTIAFDLSQPIKLAEGLYWVGSEDERGIIQKNAYLRIYERDNVKAYLLINIGTITDYARVRSKAEQLIGTIDSIKGVLIFSSEIDQVSGLVNLLQSNPRVFVITSLNIAQKLRAVGIPSGRIKSIESFPGGRLKLVTGHVLRFIPTPFTPEAGSFVVLEEGSGYLFSGKFLSSYCTIEEFRPHTSASPDDIVLFADLNMPSREHLRRAIKKLRVEAILSVFPLAGLPLWSSEVVQETFKRIENSDVGNLLPYTDREYVFEVCASIIRVLREHSKKEDYSLFFEELNQVIYMDGERIGQSLVEPEELPSFILSLMLMRGINPTLIKRIIRQLYLSGVHFTI